MNPASSINGVTIVLLFLWFIVLYYGNRTPSPLFLCFFCVCVNSLTSAFSFFQPAYNFSVENQTLTEALDEQQNRVHDIYSTIAGNEGSSVQFMQCKSFFVSPALFAGC